MTRARLTILVSMAMLVLGASGVSGADPMGTAFTYQGFLTTATGPANGDFDFRFILYDDDAGGFQEGPIVIHDGVFPNPPPITVTNGRFTVDLDFGTRVFTGDARWLSIDVRYTGVGSYFTLSPRQELTPTPYAIYAETAGSASGGITAVYGGNGLTGGGTSGAVYLHAGAGDGIDVLADAVAVDVTDFAGSGLGEEATNNLKVNTGTGLEISGDAVRLTSTYSSGSAYDSRFVNVTGDEMSGSVSDPYAVLEVTNSGTGRAVDGYASNSGSYTNYGGYFKSNGDTGKGVFGWATGDSGRGVEGVAANYTDGVENFGGYFVADGTSGRGVYGCASRGLGAATTYGGYFVADGGLGRGVYGYASRVVGTTYGGYFEADSSSGTGVYGRNNSSGNYGYLGGDHGVYGYNNDNGSYGYLGGSNSCGVYGNSGTGVGVYGISSGGWAGFFNGNVFVTGTINKGAVGFTIDHPLDPENKYLYHSGVESPDMMNVYNGNIVLDANGEAIVELPDYFEALNRGFRYQLTAIGAPCPNLHIAEKIVNNRFSMAGGEPGVEVSWQVTGIRKDAFAEANRMPVEVEKPDADQGKYLHPEAYGLGQEDGIHYEEHNPEWQSAGIDSGRHDLEQR